MDASRIIAQTPPVIAFLDDFPHERDLIGRMVLAYGGLEFHLVTMIAAVNNGDADPGLRALFRLRSEASRLEVADAMSRHFAEVAGLLNEYVEAMAAINHCRRIRNQYAHCTWLRTSEGLFVGNMERAAKGKDGACQLEFAPLPRDMVEAQADYFEYADECFTYLLSRLGVPVMPRKGKAATKPARQLPPPLCSPRN